MYLIHKWNLNSKPESNANEEMTHNFPEFQNRSLSLVIHLSHPYFGVGQRFDAIYRRGIIGSTNWVKIKGFK